MIAGLSFEDVVRSTNRIPFSNTDMEVVMSVLKAGSDKGRDLTLGAPEIADSPSKCIELANHGVVVVTSPRILQTSFMFTKNDAGRSFFGKQKAVYTSYINTLGYDEWTVGSVFKLWTVAMTSIGNVYRHEGCR